LTKSRVRGGKAPLVWEIYRGIEFIACTEVFLRYFVGHEFPT
jgi:hypothetical protein